MNTNLLPRWTARFLLYGIIPAVAFLLVRIVFLWLQRNEVDTDVAGSFAVTTVIILVVGSILAYRQATK